MLRATGSGTQHPLECQIVGLAPAPREHDAVDVLAAQGIRHGLPCRVYCLPRFPTPRVRGIRIPESFREKRRHGREDVRVQRCRRVVVQVDSHDLQPEPAMAILLGAAPGACHWPCAGRLPQDGDSGLAPQVHTDHCSRTPLRRPPIPLIGIFYIMFGITTI